MNYSKEDVIKFVLNKLYRPNGKFNSGMASKASWKKQEIDLNQSYINDIIELTSFIDTHKPTLSERCWYIINDVWTVKTCKTCNKYVKYIASTFKTYCSVKCSANDSVNKENRKKTCLKKYGAAHHLKNKEILQKQKVTNLLRYGEENVSSVEQFQKKRKQTCKELFGNESFFKSEIGQEKITQGMINRYGVARYSMLPECKEQIKQTCQEKYGTSNPYTASLINHIPPESLIKLNDKQWLTEQHHILQKSHRQIAFEIGVTQPTVSDRCRALEIETKYYNSSWTEKQILDFITSFYSNTILTNTREIIPPKELDIYLPEHKLAIELNGAYWHSTGAKCDQNYHIDKTEECQKQNIQLLHIFDTEWNEQQEIWKSIIKNKLGLNDTTLYARQTTVQEIEPGATKDFLEANHLQGNVYSKVNLGLYFGGELVSLMTFSKPRFSKQYQWELVRFCNKLNTKVTGAASKLLAHFEKHYQPVSIVSYADRRYSNGNLYNKLGFAYSHNSNPNYHYYKAQKLYSRLTFQKHKLKDLLAIYDEKLTEKENMHNNGYDIVYDSGNLVYIKALLQP